MGQTGLERHPVSDCNCNSLEQSGNAGAAESGASGGKSGALDPDLAVVVDVWPTLPDAVKVGILAMVRAAK